MSIKHTFGEKLREVRERRKMTMKEVAEKAGVTESLISQIERNKVSPAIDTLLTIADVLDIDMEYLFSDFRKSKEAKVVRKEERSVLTDKGIRYEKISSAGEETTYGIEAYYIEIPPEKEKGNIEYGHIGTEMGIIVQGKAELVYGKNTYSLSEGDSISFESDIPHIIRNTGKSDMRAFWIITPPKSGRR